MTLFHSLHNRDRRPQAQLPLGAFLIALGLLLAAAPVSAKRGNVADRPDGLDAVEIDRPLEDLPDDLQPVPEDSGRADTVLLFTNPSRRPVTVRCVGFDRAGDPIGRIRTAVGPHGLKHVLASDLSNGEDYLGQVHCSASGRVIPSAVLVGPDVENLNVVGGAGSRRLIFPTVVTY